MRSLHGSSKRSLLWLLLLAMTVAGCRQGPGRDELRRAVQRRLDERFGKGLFAVQELSRKGHYPLSPLAGQQRVLVYYDAALRFERDHRLAAWNQHSVGSLVSLLGATPLGVQGVKAKGNSKGDLLQVRGALAWARARKGAGWTATSFAPQKGKKRRGPAGELLPYRKQLQQLGQIGARLHKARQEPALAAMTDELQTLVDRSERRLGRALGWTTLATGRPSGEYNRQGQALVQLLGRNKPAARAYRSAGSTENCQLVGQGEVLFAYSQNDIAAQALAGHGTFAGAPLPRLRALCSLYPEALQIVTLAASGLRELSALRGKRIDIGPRGSGSRVNALGLLAAAGLSKGDFAAVRGQQGFAKALADLEAKKVDAVFFTSVFPHSAVQQLATRVGIDLLAPPAEVVAALRAKQPYVLPLTIPERTYPGVKGPRQTVGAMAMLIARDDAPAERVKLVLETLYSNVDVLARDSVQGYFISPKTAQKGLSIPLHPAAKRYFDAQIPK